MCSVKPPNLAGSEQLSRLGKSSDWCFHAQALWTAGSGACPLCQARLPERMVCPPADARSVSRRGPGLRAVAAGAAQCRCDPVRPPGAVRAGPRGLRGSAPAEHGPGTLRPH